MRIFGGVRSLCGVWRWCDWAPGFHGCVVHGLTRTGRFWPFSLYVSAIVILSFSCFLNVGGGPKGKRAKSDCPGLHTPANRGKTLSRGSQAGEKKPHRTPADHPNPAWNLFDSTCLFGWKQSHANFRNPIRTNESITKVALAHWRWWTRLLLVGI